MATRPSPVWFLHPKASQSPTSEGVKVWGGPQGRRAGGSGGGCKGTGRFPPPPSPAVTSRRGDGGGFRRHPWTVSLGPSEALTTLSSSFTALCVQVLSRVRLFATPWTVAHRAPLSTGFSRQEYWSGCHFLLQGIFLTQRSKLCLFQRPRQSDSEATTLAFKVKNRKARNGMGLMILPFSPGHLSPDAPRSPVALSLSSRC